MVKRKKSVWKKVGCVLISASIIMTGWTFLGSITSEAGDYNSGVYTLSESETISSSTLSGYKSDLTKITYEDGTSVDLTLEDSALQGYTSLETLKVSGNLSLDELSVAGDTSLRYLICNTMTNATASSFSGCSNITFSISGGTNSTYHVDGGALYNGTRLVYVPKSAGETFTVATYTTEVEENAFTDSNVKIIKFPDGCADNITIHDQASWPKSGTSAYLLGSSITSADAVYKFFAITNNGKCSVYLDEDGGPVSTNTYDITIAYKYYDADGNLLDTATFTTLSVNEGDVPSYTADSTVTYGGASYGLTESPTFTAATAPTTYYFKYTAGSTPTPGPTPTPTPTPTPSPTPSSGGSSSSSSSGGSKAVAPAPVPATSAETAKYKVTEGANQSVTQNAGPVKITCDGPVEKLTAILIDGSPISGDRYTIQSGSTILTFTGGFVKIIPVGDHTVRFQYTDGYAETGLKVTAASTKTTTTVTYKVSSDGSISSGHTKDTTPTTADGFDNRYILCLAIFLLGAGAILFSRQKKLEAILAGEREDY